MATYTRHSDGMPVTADEALANGLLKNGYRIHFNLMTKDHAPGGAGRIMMFDSAATRFMDALPSAQADKINEIIADAGSNEVFRVQRARQAAMAMSYVLGGAAFASPSLTTDSQRRAGLEGSAFMRALADQAFQHENSLYARSAQGDRTVDVGAGPETREIARDKANREMRDAWKTPAGLQADNGPPAPALVVTGDARADAYEQHKIEMANAWRTGK